MAESKTMSSEQISVSEEDFSSHRPILETMADETMAFISSLSVNEIAELLNISHSLAVKGAAYAYDFPNKKSGYSPLDGYTGEVFKAFNASSLSKNERNKTDESLRIISSLYGILKPSDIIKPYRLEFNKNCAPGNTSITKFLKPKVTIEFVKFLKESNEKEVIDLLPADADGCLDWKIIRSFSKVHKISFKSIDPSGKLKTPIAKKLKEMRGKMARFIIDNSFSSFSQLSKAENEDFFFSIHDSKPGLPVFII